MKTRIILKFFTYLAIMLTFVMVGRNGHAAYVPLRCQALRAPATEDASSRNVRQRYGIEIRERPLGIPDNYSLPAGAWIWDDEEQKPYIVTRFSPFMRFEQGTIHVCSPGDHRAIGKGKYSILGTGHHYFLHNSGALPYVGIAAARDDRSLLQKNTIVRRYEAGVLGNVVQRYGIVRDADNRCWIEWFDGNQTHEYLSHEELLRRPYEIMLALGDERAYVMPQFPAPGHVNTIFFDVGGVILTCDYRRAAQRLASHSTLPEDEIVRVLVSPYIMVPFETGQLTPERHFEIVSDALHLHDLTPQRFRAIFTEIYTVRPEAVAIMRRLHETGYRIIIVSNTNAVHKEYLLKTYSEIFAIVDGFIASNEVGAMKPDRKMFDAALAEAGVQPGQAIFIDDVAAYTDAARLLGVNVLQTTPEVNLGQELLGILAAAAGGNDATAHSAFRAPASAQRKGPVTDIYHDEQGRYRVRWDSIPEGPGKEKLAEIRRRFAGQLYVVGGWVRDIILLGRPSSDMDLALSSRSPYVTIQRDGGIAVSSQAPWDIFGMSPRGDSDAGQAIYTQPYFHGMAVDLVASVISTGGMLYPEYADFSFNFMSMGFLSSEEQDPVLYDPYNGLADLFPAQGPRRARLVNAHLMNPRTMRRIVRFTTDTNLALSPIDQEVVAEIAQIAQVWRDSIDPSIPVWLSEKEGFITLESLLGEIDAWLVRQGWDIYSTGPAATASSPHHDA